MINNMYFGRNNQQKYIMAIFQLTTKLIDAIDDNKFTAGLFLDSSKAFDTVDHSLLIHSQKIRTRDHAPVII